MNPLFDWDVIGLGAIAQAKHIPALKRLQTMGEAVELVAGADIDQENRRERPPTPIISDGIP